MKLSYSFIKNTLTWKVLKNAGWSAASTPITIVLGIIQTGMMARILGPEGIGYVVLFAATCAIFEAFLKITSNETTLVYVTKAISSGNNENTDHLIRYCYSLDFMSSFVASSTVALIAIFIPRLLNLQNNIIWLQAFYALTIIFQSTNSVSLALLRITNNFSWSFLQSVTHSILKTSFVAVLFFNKAGLKEVVFLLVVLTLFDGLSLFILANIAIKRNGFNIFKKFKISFHVPIEIWKFQFLGYGRRITKVIYGYIDVLMIGYLANPVSVGLFRSARQLTDPLDIPTQALISSLTPEYSRLWFNKEKQRLRRLVFRFTLFSLAGFGVLALIISLFSSQIIHIVLGDAFLPSKIPMLILLLAILLSTVMTPLNSMQVATGQAGPSTIAGLATIAVQALLIVLLVPKFNIIGAAWAKVGGVLVSLLIMLPTGIKRLQLDDK